MSAACSNIKPPESNGNLGFINTGETQWMDVPDEPIQYASKEETIMLSGGLTILQDKLIQAALQSLGEN